MGRWIAGKRSPVQRDARPGEALHMGHVAILVQVRIVLRVLLENAKDAGGCLAPLLTTRYRRPQDPTLRIVDFDPLASQRNNRHNRIAICTWIHRLDRRY